jgi:hypothetical protein
MSFNGSWVYTLPALYNPVVGGTRIRAAWANTTLSDIATALTALGALVEPGQAAGTSVGYLDIPQVTPAAGAYTLVLTDRGCCVYKTDAANITVPQNSAVAFPIGATVSIRNFNAAAMTIVEDTNVDLYLVGSATPGNRTLAAYGLATFRKESTNAWCGMGSGLT